MNTPHLDGILQSIFFNNINGLFQTDELRPKASPIRLHRICDWLEHMSIIHTYRAQPRLIEAARSFGLLRTRVLCLSPEDAVVFRHRTVSIHFLFTRKSPTNYVGGVPLVVPRSLKLYDRVDSCLLASFFFLF